MPNLNIYDANNLTTPKHVDHFDYAVAIGQQLFDIFDSDTAKVMFAKYDNIRFHTKENAATNITIPTLVDRSVHLNLLDKDKNLKPVKAVSRQGSLIVSKPCEDGVLISLAHQVFEHETMGTVTALTVHQAICSIGEQINNAIRSNIMEVIEKDTNKGKYFVEDAPVVASGAGLVALGDSLQDAIYTAQFNSNQFGSDLSDFTLAVTQKAYTALSLLAKKAGHDTVEDFVGTSVSPFTPKDVKQQDKAYGYLVPNRHCAVSMLEFKNGEIMKMDITPDGNTASTTIEMRIQLDLLIAGFTEVEVPTMGTAGKLVEINVPLIRKFEVTTKA
jgi:hypothetical protein